METAVGGRGVTQMEESATSSFHASRVVQWAGKPERAAEGATRQTAKGIARVFALLVMAALLTGLAPAAFGSAGNNDLKLYEVAGAGGLSGASYRQDTIVLFNPTPSAINCSTCAIQTHSASSNTSSWTVYKLPPLSIPAGGYYMISASSVNLATYGSVAPIPYDYQLQTIELGTAPPNSQNILSSTSGVVALTNTQTALSTSSSSVCGTGSQLVDVVGYGSSFGTNASTAASPSICYAGSGPAYYDGSTQYGRQLGVTRKNKCTDSFDNSNDWANTPLVFYNSASTPTPCPTGTQLSAVIAANPTNPGVTEAVTFTAAVTSATNPSSSGVTAFLDFDSPYFKSSTLQMFDDGTHGDTRANDGIFTVATSIPSGTAIGFNYPTNVTVNDTQGNSYTGSVLLTIPAGGVTMSTSSTAGSIAAGGVLTFPITITGVHGYGGVLKITCTGAPNTNSLGVPVSTQCVSTPPEVTISNDGAAKISVAIATGTTTSSGLAPRSFGWGMLLIVGLVVITFGIWRRRSLFATLPMALAVILLLHTTACGTDAGMGNTAAAPGTYTYTVTATDSSVSTVANSLTFTVTVQ